MYKPRDGQAEIIQYTSGRMGITAVPGSGKTHTLSYLAARLIASDILQEDQEILIVTLVNSAVNNFSARISEFLTGFGLIPGVGYRVRTLHGLAYDIVREQPHLAGMDNMFSIADERTCNDILSIASINWMRQNTEIIMDYSAENVDIQRTKRIWGETIQSISHSGISICKDYLISPNDLLEKIQNAAHPLLHMCQRIYADYDRALQDRGAVDFADLIRLAYIVLENNPDFLQRLQDRWPFILEDEAQDSSRIQEMLLGKLSSKESNWVRVGDPNQAIFETFTTADPKLLRQFVQSKDVASIDLPHSGRSTSSIITLANYLVDWTKNHHPRRELRYALDEPLIKSTPPDDPQPNPPDNPDHVILFDRELTPEEELRLVARSAEKWIKENQDKTAAILIPRNARGSEMVEQLTHLRVPTVELLSSSKTTRDTATILRDIIRFYASPLIRRNLTNAFKSIANHKFDQDNSEGIIKKVASHLSKIKNPELLFTPPDGMREFANAADIDENERSILTAVFSKLNYWQTATILPIDEMIITICADLFTDASDLALVHKIALLLKRAKNYYPSWQLSDFADELDAIATNRYRLHGFTEDNMGFDPDNHKGEVVVSTMHKAKGLEWDKVYLMSVNNYNYPSLSEFDTYISEKWFVKDNRNLEAEVIDSIKRIYTDDFIEDSDNFIKHAAHDARVEFCAERLRLLYVGITRAREEIVITWNNGRRNNCVEALPLQALREFWGAHKGKNG